MHLTNAQRLGDGRGRTLAPPVQIAYPGAAPSLWLRPASDSAGRTRSAMLVSGSALSWSIAVAAALVIAAAVLGSRASAATDPAG